MCSESWVDIFCYCALNEELIFYDQLNIERVALPLEGPANYHWCDSHPPPILHYHQSIHDDSLYDADFYVLVYRLRLTADTSPLGQPEDICFWGWSELLLHITLQHSSKIMCRYRCHWAMQRMDWSWNSQSRPSGGSMGGVCTGQQSAISRKLLSSKIMT